MPRADSTSQAELLSKLLDYAGSLESYSLALAEADPNNNANFVLKTFSFLLLELHEDFDRLVEIDVADFIDG